METLQNLTPSEITAIILGILFAIGEALSYIPSVKANGVFQLVFGIVCKLKGAPKEGKANPRLLALCALAVALLFAIGCAGVCNEGNVKAGLAAANNSFAVVTNVTADAIETGALDGAAEEKVLKVLAITHDALISAERFEALGMVEEACQSIETATGALGRVK